MTSARGSTQTARSVRGARRLIYGLLIGSVTVIIRLFGGLTEGVMYAILLGNAATPLIDQLTQPRVFGSQRAGK